MTRRSRSAANETGAVAALPIWMDFMKAYIASRPDKDHRPEFQAPGNIVFLPVEKANGHPASAGTPGTITETFIAGTQPGELAHPPQYPGADELPGLFVGLELGERAMAL